MTKTPHDTGVGIPGQVGIHPRPSRQGPERVDTQQDGTRQAPPRHREVLAAAVRAIHGTPRPGQQQMADSVAEALSQQCHLLVQAGTGTGKSLGYLVPVMLHAQKSGKPTVVATATLALQSQLATKDIPTAAAAVAAVTGREPVSALVKGRSNYACLLRALEGGIVEQDSLLGADEMTEVAHAASSDPESALGAEVVALREWVNHQRESDGLADRDDAPPHSPMAWAQVSVSSRECLGARCAFHDECFVEASRARARQADLVVTNHALLAIDALNERSVLPEHDAVVIDEAHELTSRVTGAASQELSPQQVDRIARKAAAWLDDQISVDLFDAADALKGALDSSELGRVNSPDGACGTALARIRELSRTALSGLSHSGGKGTVDTERAQVQAGMQEVFETAERMAALAEADVVWISERLRFGRQLCVAPLSVAGLLRHAILSRATTVLTSATLALGGSFGAIAGQVGLKAVDRVESPADAAGFASSDPAEGGGEPQDISQWCGIDVGSPFDYPKQAILYVAAKLPRPGREGVSDELLAQIAELVWAADGHTLGLFSSQRAADAAARHLRTELPKLPVLCQGEMQLPELTRRFAEESTTSLFGTMSLWQGIDVPGESCRLVIIDRIPFPRPDDPLSQARQQAVSKAGGNGFMRIAATHAALMLAQGAGRLVRSGNDRGVVAILDSRLVTARYGSFLRASLPPFWTTTSLDVAENALRRLSGQK